LEALNIMASLNQEARPGSSSAGRPAPPPGAGLTAARRRRQGGKNCRDPILREDVLLQRMPHLRPKPAEGADAFAPEYGAETWHQKAAAAPAHARGAAAAMASWRRNPNERSQARTNRRKR